MPHLTCTCVFLSLLQGMMKGQELSEAYASADVFVMPSETETLGFVVLEAMASGVPVVAVAAGGLTDIVQHEKTGAWLRPVLWWKCERGAQCSHELLLWHLHCAPGCVR